MMRFPKGFFQNLGDVVKTCLAQYFCELAITICPREQNSEEFLKLILNSLYLLSENKRSAQLLSRALKCALQVLRDICLTLECAEFAANICVTICFFFPKAVLLNVRIVTVKRRYEDFAKPFISHGFKAYCLCR